MTPRSLNHMTDSHENFPGGSEGCLRHSNQPVTITCFSFAWYYVKWAGWCAVLTLLGDEEYDRLALQHVVGPRRQRIKHYIDEVLDSLIATITKAVV
jgi:hypothetical protein